ncbi:hypothetical protein H4R18_001881 [Coemansia javaensis]|uniref:Mediator of RNA polymerase II transcription subunit 13 n=1 Tax=Coemansia javaensis TaxID=2761396 RepID=A0A9W8HDU4_9FUNG|nr:hypothetical protein H4R18_001881 [Coemansia javaensis]
MGDLETNLIALPVPEQLIPWRRYEVGAGAHRVVLSTCHGLLDARVPCLWRPAGACDDSGSDVVDAIARGDALRETAAATAWEVWAFHALAPEQDALARAPIPPEFTAVGSGEITWSAGPLLASGGSGDGADVQGIFHRALDNLIDRALVQLSMVRFGLRQWIGPDQAPDAPGTPGQTVPGDGPLAAALEGADACLPLGAEAFARDSAALDDPRAPGSAADDAPGSCVLRITVSTCAQGLLVQHNARREPGLRPLGRPGSLGGLRFAGGGGDEAGLVPVARARIAPYGAQAAIVGEPDGPLGEAEEQVLQAWSEEFGYSRRFLAGDQQQQQQQQQQGTSLVWITVAPRKEPMLYPRRLVFIDTDTDEAPERHCTADDGSTALADLTPPPQSPAAATGDDAVPSLERAKDDNDDDEEREEGEAMDEKDDGEEEGEIADPATPEHSADDDDDDDDDGGGDSDSGDAPEPTRFDEAMDRLDAEAAAAASAVERSLAAIQTALVQFRAEEEREELELEQARRRAQIAKEEAQAAKAAANGTRKRQRSVTKGSAGSNKARRKSNAAQSDVKPEPVADAKLSIKPDTKPDMKPERVANDDDDDVPLQALIADPPPVEATEAVDSSTVAADIDALFGDVGGAQGESGAELVFDQAVGGGGGGDAGLGMDMDMGMGMSMGMSMGMNMGMGMGMGDFGGGIFDVTDDDFSFFDSIPAAPKVEPVALQFGATPAPEPVAVTAVNSSGTPGPAAHAEHDADADPLRGGGGGDNDDDDDDDGVFDSFFDEAGPAARPVPAISSPPGVASVLSTTETHVGPGDAAVADLAATAADLATPASIRATPAQSTDILTPTPTAVAGCGPAKAAGGLEPVAELEAAVAEPAAAPRPAQDRAQPSDTGPYGSVRTAFDGGARAWLRDGPAPMRADGDGDAGPLADRALDPAAWVRRRAARAAARGGVARRLRGWLAAYRARLAYAGGLGARHAAADAAPGAQAAAPAPTCRAAAGRGRAPTGGSTRRASFVSIIGPAHAALPPRLAPPPPPPPPAPAAACTALVARCVPPWMRAAADRAERIGDAAVDRAVTWPAAFAALLGATAASTCRAEAAGGPGGLGARLGGLLALGSGSRAARRAGGPEAAGAGRPALEPGTAEALADWAVHGALLRCVARREARDAGAAAWAAAALAPALAAAWGGGAGGCRALTLAQVAALQGAAAPVRYRGFVVKRRRADDGDGDGGGAAALVPVPAAPGVVEALPPPALVAGVHAEAAGPWRRRRDGEALGARRWRHARRLARRALAGGGAGDDAEEGEEREPRAADADSADDGAADPDAPARGPAAEDALRRPCVAAAPAALRWWAPLHMRPLGPAKNVRWAALPPPGADAAPAARFLADVDSAYQAAHLGAHAALRLPPAADLMRADPKSAGPWSARLASRARRVGRAMGRAWRADPDRGAHAAVLYVLVPHSSDQRAWVALAAAAAAAARAFAAAAGAAAAPLVAHPLPLDRLAAAHRAPVAPSARETAMAVYARCAAPGAGFAQRAFAVSMPSAFPPAHGAVAAAAVPASWPALAAPPPWARRADDPRELDEACVAMAPPPLDGLRARLVAHPLRPADALPTLHCVYAVAGRWVAVCWCDERGEYVEHAAIANDAPPAGLALGPAAQARVWRGALRYQALVGGPLRLVLAEWRGMAPPQARAWLALHAECRAPVRLLVASVGAAPSDGLRMARPAQPADPPLADVVQWSLVLHPQPPLAFARPTLDEPLDACSARARRPCPTGYLVLHDRRPAPMPQPQQPAAAAAAAAAALPCLCLQLLADPACADQRAQALSVRAILRQYHQLAALAAAADHIDCAPAADQPLSLPLPLPVATVARICDALELTRLGC